MSEFGNFLKDDWYIAWPMLAMSITAMALVIWRILLYVNGNTKMDEFLPVFQEKLQKEGTDGALRFCRSRTDLIPRKLFVAGLETAKQGAGAMRRSMANVIELEILPDLNFLLPTILGIAKIATMVGLLGTVISMINTFKKIQDASRQVVENAANAVPSDNSITGSSGAIGLALFATALGLVTAIPLVFSHVLFKAFVARFELKMKSGAQKLMVLVQNLKGGTSKTTAPGTIAATPTTAGR